MEFKMPQFPVGTKHFCWGLVVGAGVMAWTGFDALGWKSNGAAEAMANKKAEAAVVSAYAAICRDQFSKGADFSTRLSSLQKLERYSRGDAVAKGGWATMSGGKEPQQGVAQECAELLLPAKS
jgi:hypothetical protein